MNPFKNPTILVVFNVELVYHKLTVLARVQMQLIKHSLNIYFLLSNVEFQCIKEK